MHYITDTDLTYIHDTLAAARSMAEQGRVHGRENYASSIDRGAHIILQLAANHEEMEKNRASIMRMHEEWELLRANKLPLVPIQLHGHPPQAVRDALRDADYKLGVMAEIGFFDEHEKKNIRETRTKITAALETKWEGV